MDQRDHYRLCDAHLIQSLFLLGYFTCPIELGYFHGAFSWVQVSFSVGMLMGERDHDRLYKRLNFMLLFLWHLPSVQWYSDSVKGFLFSFSPSSVDSEHEMGWLCACKVLLWMLLFESSWECQCGVIWPSVIERLCTRFIWKALVWKHNFNNLSFRISIFADKA